MLWQLEIATRERFVDPVAHQVEKDLPWLGLARAAPVSVTRLFLFETTGDDPATAERLATELFADGVVDEFTIAPRATRGAVDPRAVTVCRKAGVMDPVEESIRRGASSLGLELGDVRTGLCFRFGGGLEPGDLERIGERLLANAVVNEILVGATALPSHVAPAAYRFERADVDLAAEVDLLAVSRDRGLALNLVEMQAVQAHFAELGRAPTDIELETIAQTWSEHCKHKTFGAIVHYEGRRIDNLLKSTIFQATADLDRDFCVSVFKDNAGIVRFDDDHHLCIKVETHNHPSAIEPYGGAGTGLGGVIRDILGTGLGGKPVANIDVFCVGLPDTRPEDLPTGVIHPLRVLKGVVAGVRDYGNRMGIPTVCGAVFFDDRYAGNPLVYCGTVGLIRADRTEKRVAPGDRIVAIGGRTGRDGIHGATFSSRELHEDSERLDGGAVQIGNAITEKRAMDVLLTARDRGLYRSVTDCGAGGFSSAIGEMGEETGARVQLDAAPLKYPGLSYLEAWISEAQERMVFAVPPEHLDELLALAKAEDVEACVLGEFTGSGRLEIDWAGERVADLDMDFLHNGLPRPELEATWSPPPLEDLSDFRAPEAGAALVRLLASPNVASKEWIVRQYDHEVQSTSCVKPLVGVHRDGPGDAAVNAPILGSTRGFALGCGLDPHLSDLDPYHMAMAAVDEALRNVVCVGGDPNQVCLLDNFSWGNTSKPDRLGALVRASEGCRDASLAFRAPFVSGKDSLNNEYATSAGTIVIPHTLLVTALAIVHDVREAVTMDAKRAGSVVYVVGATRRELGGSQYLRLDGRRGNDVPRLDRERAPRVLAAMHHAIRQGLVLSCHDCSEGGLAVAAAELAFSGDLGVDLDLTAVPVEAAGRLTDDEILFSESLTRFVVEVAPSSRRAFEEIFVDLPSAAVGEVTAATRFRVRGAAGHIVVDESLARLHEAHKFGLTRVLEGEPHA